MTPNLRDASPVLWAGLSIAALGWPITLGLMIGALPSIRPFFRGDRSLWFAFWRLTVVALWAVAAVVVFLMARAGVTLAMVGAVAPSRAVGLLAGAVVVAIAAAAWVVSARNATADGPTEHGLIFLPHSRRERLFMALVIAPSAALCEELVYRGFVLTLLSSALGFWSANAVQAALFAFHHGGTKQGGPAYLGRACIGLAFGFVAMRTGTLTLVIALHYLLDAALSLRPGRATVAAQVA